MQKPPRMHLKKSLTRFESIFEQNQKKNMKLYIYNGSRYFSRGVAQFITSTVCVPLLIHLIFTRLAAASIIKPARDGF